VSPPSGRGDVSWGGLEAFSRVLSYHALVDAHWMLLSMLANQAVFTAPNTYTWPVVLSSGCRSPSYSVWSTRTSRAGDLRDLRRPGVTLEPRSLNTLLDDP
jgi:hypothetical protein